MQLITKMKDDRSYIYTTAVSMQTLQILDVVSGFWQIPTKDVLKSSGVHDIACCFTILFSSATWYIEAETPQKQVMWVHAISWLKNFLGSDLRRAIPLPPNPLSTYKSHFTLCPPSLPAPLLTCLVVCVFVRWCRPSRFADRARSECLTACNQCCSGSAFSVQTANERRARGSRKRQRSTFHGCCPQPGCCSRR